MQSKFHIIFLFFFVLFSCVDDNENFVIDKKEYKNKLEGFWLGQSIANWTGIITEMDKKEPWAIDMAEEFLEEEFETYNEQIKL